MFTPLFTLTVHVRGTTSRLFVDGRAGNDVVNVGSTANTLSAIFGAVSVNGAEGADFVNLYDQGTTAAQTYTFTGFELQRSGAAAVSTNFVESLSLDAGSGGDTIRVQGVGGDYTDGVRIGTGAGNDTVTVSSTSNTLATFRQPLNLLQQGGNDTVTLTDTGNAAAQTVTVENFGFRLAGGPLIGTGLIPNRIFNAGSGNDTFNIVNTFEGISTTLNTGAGNDTVRTTYNTGANNELRGPVTVNGQDGTDAVIFDDPGGAAQTWTMQSNSLARTGAATVSYDFTTENVTLNAGSGNDTINVLGTRAGGSTAVNAGSGNDTVRLTLNGSVVGPMTIAGQGGSDALIFDEPSAGGANLWTVTAGSVVRGAAGQFSYATVEALTLNAGAAADTFNVQGTAAGVMTTINAGAGDDAVNVGNAGLLDPILGGLTFNGQDGNDTLTANDQAAAAGQTYTLTASTLARSGAAVLTYGTLETLTLNAGLGDDMVNVRGTSALSTVNAGAGNDTILLTNAGSTLDGIGRVNVDGQAGAADRVLGGEGPDYLHGDEAGNVLAGNGGDDILVGAGDADLLLGGDGRDLLFGGLGADVLDGGAGEDLVIDGVTSYDDDVVALSEVWNEWTRLDVDYLGRIDNLRNGAGLSTRVLDATTVTGDDEADVLYGGDDLDWFWAEKFDLTDRVDPDEVAN